MTDTSVEEPLRIEKGLAAGYARTGGKLVNAGYVDLRFIPATGAVASTLDDLRTWERVLRSDRLLSEAQRAKLFSPVRADYAYGWWIQSRLGRRVQWHRGNVQGFVAVIMRFPDSDLFIAVLSNVERTGVLAMAIELGAIALGEPYELPRERVAAAVEPAALEPVLGTYRADTNAADVFTVKRESEKLAIEIGGATAFEVQAWSATRLFAAGFEWDVTFVSDTDGKVTHAVRRMDGETLRFSRVR